MRSHYIEDCAKEFITIAEQNYNDNAVRLKADLENTCDLIDTEHEKHNQIVCIKKIRKTIKQNIRGKSFYNTFICVIPSHGKARRLKQAERYCIERPDPVFTF